MLFYSIKLCTLKITLLLQSKQKEGKMSARRMFGLLGIIIMLLGLSVININTPINDNREYIFIDYIGIVCLGIFLIFSFLVKIKMLVFSTKTPYISILSIVSFALMLIFVTLSPGGENSTAMPASHTTLFFTFLFGWPLIDFFNAFEKT